MDHVFDNPIWHGLLTSNKALNQGSDEAKFFSLSVSAHVGLRKNSGHGLEYLYQLLPPQRTVTLFSDALLPISNHWDLLEQRPLLQLVYPGKESIPASDSEVKPLDISHVPAMLALTQLTGPGPFQPNTLAFGQYQGIFRDGELVAMAGYRFQPHPYVKISAVCTHPAHLGQGLAGRVIRSLIENIFRESRIPFLHVSSRNKKALSLYEKLGFLYRRELTLYTIQKRLVKDACKAQAGADLGVGNQ